MKGRKVLVSAAVGVVGVVGAVAVFTFVGASSAPSSLVAIAPCRLLDTRSNSQVGEHPGPIKSAETATIAVVGTHGDCTIPAEANAIAANVTIANPKAPGYLTVFPADATLPTASNLNWSAGQQPTPNHVTVGLSTGGEINIFSAGGGNDVDVIVDIVGYYQAGGAPGPVLSAGNWGIVDRNTIGSPEAELRSGPFTPAVGPVAASGPPMGSGSLNLSVGSSTEKAAYGNEVDFFNVDFLGVNAVGFHVFQVGENVTQGPAAMPSIAIEIDPNAATSTSNFSTLTFVPQVTGPGWSGFIDATTTGLWGGTGEAFAGTPCDLQGSLCSWADLKTQLDDGGDAPVVLSVSISKGRDQEWHGAVDGLQVGATVYDFEEGGVVATPA